MVTMFFVAFGDRESLIYSRDMYFTNIPLSDVCYVLLFNREQEIKAAQSSQQDT